MCLCCQFRVGEDFDAYPRDVEGDREKLRAEGVDVAFEPESLYAPGRSCIQAPNMHSDCRCY